MPLVSVVLIFLDAERFIAEALDSVLNQSLSDWELILVDDGSSDGSTASAQRYAETDPRIRYVEHAGHANRGRSESRNVGAALSSGRYLAFLDADDVWGPAKLAEQVAVLEQDPEVAMVCGAMIYWHSWDADAVKADRFVLTGGLADRRLDPPEPALQLYPLGTSAGAGVDFLVRRHIFEELGGFEARFRGLYDDQTFLVKVFLRYPTFFASRPWLWYRQHAESCCATTLRSQAEYHRIRAQFLNWLGDFMRREQLRDPGVRRMLSQARRRNRVQAVRSQGIELLRAARARLRSA